MDKIKVMVNGIPGNMATLLAEHVIKTEGFQLIPYSLTGPEISTKTAMIGDTEVKLILPADRNLIEYTGFNNTGMIAADFTHPTAAVSNAQLYRTYHVPFVMGTTGGDRDALYNVIRGADISAVIAPNMAAPIVLLMAMFEWAANTFPGALEGLSADLQESHQAGKADTSGTMRAMLDYLNQLGIPCSIDDIRMIRKPAEQLALGIPEDALGGHAYHWYSLSSPDGTTTLEIRHNVIGRDIYAQGALQAIRFLYNKIKGGMKGHAYSMFDVMKG